MCHSRALLPLVVVLIAAPVVFAAAPVKIWEQDIVIPTYPIGPAEPNPMFYFGRVYQGARGAIYPYPLYDKLTDKKEDKTYKAVYLENEYVKICVLPELGGRIFEAVDKTNNYDFFYRQHVIKPSLIGMLGSWISGGVEWNVPHHHRASSFMLVQHKVEESADGSKTVWVGELELRHRMRWAIGLTLRPGRSYLEASFRLLNRTPEEVKAGQGWPAVNKSVSYYMYHGPHIAYFDDLSGVDRGDAICQFGGQGRAILGSAAKDGVDEAGAEEHLPVAIDRDTGRQRMIGPCDPRCELQSAALPGRNRQCRDAADEGRRVQDGAIGLTIAP